MGSLHEDALRSLKQPAGQGEFFSTANIDLLVRFIAHFVISFLPTKQKDEH